MIEIANTQKYFESKGQGNYSVVAHGYGKQTMVCIGVDFKNDEEAQVFTNNMVHMGYTSVVVSRREK